MFHLSVKGRLNFQALITVILISVVGVIGYYIFSTASKNISRLIESKLPSVRDVAMLDMHHEGVKVITLQMLLAKLHGDKELIDYCHREMAGLKKNVSTIFSEFRQSESDAEAIKGWNEIENEFKIYLALSDVIMSSQPGEVNLSSAAMKDFENQFKKLEENIDHFGEKYESNNQSYFSGIQARLKSFTLVLLGILAFGVLFSLAVSQLIIKSIIRSMNSVTERIAKSSMDLGVSISQLSLSSDQLAAAVSAESSALQETAASVEQISAMILKSSENAKNTSSASDATKEKALQGQVIMKSLVVAIEEINDSNKSVDMEIRESNSRINEIMSVIQEIGNKTKVINDIVFQTKLLSFNASVEAARAGENGKGFSVVAEEVGNLAQMSGRAAKEITTLLEESVARVEKIAEESKVKIEKILSSTQEKVQKGTEVAQSFGAVLNEIVEDAQRSSDLVSEITQASSEQAKGVSEISNAINQLNKSMQVNSMAAETSSNTAESLKTQSNDLRMEASNLKKSIEGKMSVPRFIWRDEYALGIDDMDGEHKILIDKINFLATTIEKANGNSSAKVIESFTDLLDYTVEHFTDEEKFMATFSYPQIEGHKEIHKRLIATLHQHKEKVINNNYNAHELMNFLNEWLVSHILNADMKYSNHDSGKSTP